MIVGGALFVLTLVWLSLTAGEVTNGMIAVAAIALLGLGPAAVYTVEAPALQQKEPVVSFARKEAPAIHGASGPGLPPVQTPPAPPVQQPAPPAAYQAPVQQPKRITLQDIAGYSETKKSMEFIVECLRSPELLRQVGAKIPAGILLYGPPGTGKTLMARAIADTVGVNWYAVNASDFIRRYVGVGAENVQALYQKARANAPSIVFIDEIDAIGGARGGDGENQEYRQTLNALLSELDGAAKDATVMTIAATNDLDHLDPALVRPGRFDRKIAVPLPDLKDRLAIIELYAKKRNISPEVSLKDLARTTSGLAGAGLATLFNEASLHAVMCGRGVILPEDIDAALTQLHTDGVAVDAVDGEERRVSAYHEAGHAILLKALMGATVAKVSIVGSSSGIAGSTLYAEDESVRYTTQYLRARIVAVYGGRAAEEVAYGREQITAGASDDLRTASQWIKEYLQGGLGHSLLDPEVFGSVRASQTEEARAMSEELYQTAVQYLTAHRAALDRVAAALLDRETLSDQELVELMGD